MTHFGIICLSATGHVNTMFPLGRELQRRGHNVTVVNGQSVQFKVLDAGFNFQVIGESEFSAEREAQHFAQQGKLNGLTALRHTLGGADIKFRKP